MSYIPEELIRSTPREIELTVSGKLIVGLAFFLVVAGIGGGAFLYDKANGGAVRARNLQLEGNTTQGEITRVRGPAGKRRNVIVSYRYFVDGQPYDNNRTLSLAYRRRFQTGQFVSVRYLPSDPGFNSLEEFRPDTTPAWAAAALPIALSAIAGIIVLVLRKQSRYLSEGRPAIAKVYKIEKRWTGRHRTNRVHYEYSEIGGNPQTGYYSKRWSPPQPGKEFIVLYLPDSPHRSVPYPLGFVRVSGV